MDIAQNIRIGVAWADIILCSIWKAAPYLAIFVIMAAIAIRSIRRTK